MLPNPASDFAPPIITPAPLTAPIRLRNLSQDPQTRFTFAMVPTSALDSLKLGKHGLTAEGWLWQRGGEVGDQTRLWIRADLAGSELRAIDLAAFKTVTDDISWTVPPWRMDWLLDAPADAVLRLNINGQEALLAFDGVVEQGVCVQVWKFKARGGGFHTTAYATIAVGQDVFDVQGLVVWNDGRTQSVMLQGARIEIRHGEQHAGHLVASLGQQQPIPTRSPHVLLDGSAANWLPDAMALPFYFTLVAEQDTPQKKPLPPKGTIADPEDDSVPADSPAHASVHALTQQRAAIAKAALGGPILALAGAAIWHGRIGPHRARLDKPFTPAPSGFVDTVRDPWARRPWANAKASGQTGDQGIWGRIKALHIFADGDPGELLALRYSSTDYFLRSHHFLDANSQPRTFEQGPTDPCMTYGTAPFWRLSGAAWGKNGGNFDPPWGWDHGERGYLDPQHRGNLYQPIALMLLGDWVLQEELDFLLACDIRDVRLREPTSIDAPRAAGRMLQEWAWWWCSASPNQRQQLQNIALRTLKTVEAQRPYNVPGPQKWLSVFPRTDSKNPLRNTTDVTLGYEAASPWEHSFVCDGTTAWAAIFQHIAAGPEVNRFLQVAVALATSVVDGAIIEHPSAGPIVIAYVRVNPDGAANPPEYFQLPRDGAKTTLEGNADMVYGGIALTWYSGAILTAAKAGNQKAIRIRTALYAMSTSQRDVEWLVGD